MLNENCKWLDSNPGPLVSEATVQSTVPQPSYCFATQRKRFINTQVIALKSFYTKHEILTKYDIKMKCHCFIFAH